MAISVTNIGTAANTNQSGILQLTGVTVPAGSLIVVVVVDANSGSRSVSDTVNTYARTSFTFDAAIAVGEVYYAANASLSSGTITYTKSNINNGAAISAFYVTGIALTSPLDSLVTATATGNSSAPSVTSGAPAGPGELFVAAVMQAGAQSFTQDSGHSWATPPNSSTNAVSASVAGGTQVNAGQGTITFAPTLGGTVQWGAIVLAFLPAGGQAPYNAAMAFQPQQASERFFPPPPPFIGGRQPYEPKKLPPALAGIPVNNPPFTHREITASEMDRRAWWATPNPWSYPFEGGAQPYAPFRQNAPGIPGQSVDNPPFTHPELTARHRAILTSWQPEAWPPVFEGAAQPYAAFVTTANPGWSVDKPPFNLKREAPQLAIIIQAWQPPDWPHVFLGDLQAYGPLRMSSGIPGQSVDKPPFNLKRELPQLMTTILSWQPPPPQPTDPIPGYSVKFFFTFTQTMVLG